MKLVFYKTLLFCVLIACFVYEICCDQVVEYSESNEIGASLHDTSSLSIATPILNVKAPLKTIKINRIARRRRKKRRRKKKIQVISQSTTVIPTLITTISDSSNLLNTTLPSTNKLRRKRIKKRRKLGKRKETDKFVVTAITTNNSKRKNSSFYKSPAFVLETKSLVLPVVPTPKFILIKNKSSNVKKTEVRNARCSKNNGGCAHVCLFKGMEKCQCFKGFRLAEDKKNCVDINECSINAHGCQMNCTNTVGSYRCHCPRGLRLGLDSKSCEDVNECLLRNGHGLCQDTCENTYGGYKCNCNGLKGTKLANDLHNCVDLDECSKENGGCTHICINTFGRSFCSCPEGLELSLDFKTCQSTDLPRIIS